MGGRLYSQAEVDALTGTIGFTYIAWLGLLTIPILDSQRQIIALLGGTPKDVEGWTKVTDGAFALMQDALRWVKLSEETLDHRRAQQPFAAVGRGLSHGGGQMEPGELRQNVTNTRVTDELMAHSYFQRINFAESIFAACTFNFGPRAITCPHLDFANLAWGWCTITALGTFDPDAGGHLILWDLQLVIRFPPGSTVFIPSAIIRHSNIGILSHEMRSSFTQYTAGGLFRWV
ncbi:hypothetical protein DFH08DRAFT_918250 [Mycena albidolilacea]|uniref:Uncharacterized protein n=1 Tax=Mycena albidolilacea TaxID=1033008 RepID=A0AAD7EBQ2_9AGAR|nr:hypothetical protein DFH08DRAFT_918250 [Mycena albidolilacea]